MKTNSLTYEQIVNNTCDAIEILVHNAISQAGFDRTLIGTITAIIDDSKREYKVKIQDAVYKATAADLNMSFKKGDEVYILIAQNDLSKPKKIIGLVQSLGDDYLVKNSVYTQYQIIGGNTISETSNQLGQYFSYCSYDPETLDILYDADADEDFVNRLTVDETALRGYMEHAKYIQFAVDVKTLIPYEQQYTGDFGLIFEIDFVDSIDAKKTVTKTFLFDSDSMSGTVHHLSTFLNQSSIQEIDGSQYSRIRRIYAYVKDFKYNHTEITHYPNDIFLDNIAIYAMTDINDEVWNSYYLKLIATKGDTFTKNSGDKIIEAALSFQNRAIDNSKVQYYWFLQNGAVNLSHEKYCAIGGQGWYCLNPKVDNTWQPMSHTFVVDTNSFLADQSIFRCVAVYQNQTVHQDMAIYNNDSLYTLSVSSSTGNGNFVLGSGMMDLVCNIKTRNSSEPLPPDNFNFYWSKNNTANVYEALDVDNGGAAQVTNKYSNKRLFTMLTALKKYIKQEFKNKTLSETARYKSDMFNNVSGGEAETPFPFEGHMSNINELLDITVPQNTTVKQFYNLVVNYLQKTPISYIENNKFYDVTTKIINKSATIMCSVFTKDDVTSDDASYIGTASMKLQNVASDNLAKYTVAMTNKNQMFKYNAEGKSPVHSSNVSVQTLKNLSFQLFTEKGDEINPATVNQLSVKWKIPINDTMLKPIIGDDESLESLPQDEMGEYYIIENTLSLGFTIADNYNFSNGNNDIILEVIYDNVYLRDASNFSFLKDGTNGTNGTNYYCRLTPNAGIEGYPTLYARYDNNGNFFLTSNFADSLDTDVSSNLLSYFSVELLNSDIPVMPDSISWKILSGPFNKSSKPFIEIVSFSGIDRVEGEVEVTEDDNGELTNIQTTTTTTPVPETSINQEVLTQIKDEEIFPELVLQAALTYQGKKYYATLPLVLVYFNNPTDTLTHHIEMKPSTGFNEAIYSADAQNPQYNSAFPFEMSVKKREIGDINIDDNEILFYETDITDFAGTSSDYGTPFTYVWDVYGNAANMKIQDSESPEFGKAIQPWLLSLKEVTESLADGSEVTIPHKIKATPPKTYDGLSVDNGVLCKIYYHNDTAPTVSVFFPIHFYLNRYGLSHLNDWDGNSIKINEEEGYILTPQIGAGEKSQDNSFTGLIMGVVDGGEGAKKNGLIGYSEGRQSIFLDAATGKAEFGVAQAGKIIIDPTDNTAKIQSGNYNDDESVGSGMLIDFTTPEIRFGSGKFTVDENGIVSASEVNISGILAAAAESQIGPWKLGSTGLYKIPDGKEEISDEFDEAENAEGTISDTDGAVDDSASEGSDETDVNGSDESDSSSENASGDDEADKDNEDEVN